MTNHERAWLQDLQGMGRNPNVKNMATYNDVISAALDKSQAKGTVTGKCTAVRKFLLMLKEMDLTINMITIISNGLNGTDKVI